jgi:Asp-tRNA(Asn)/Glu-tRNA(Gln) amidotransferase C subunit
VKQQAEKIEVNIGNLFVQLHRDLILYIASFLRDTDPRKPYTSLLILGLVVKRFRAIILEMMWNDIVCSGDQSKLLGFVKSQSFCPSALNQIFFKQFNSEASSHPVGVNRHRGFFYFNFNIELTTVQNPETSYISATRLDFETLMAYHAYLYANPLDSYLDSHWLEADEKGQTLSQVFTKGISVFQALTLSSFGTCNHQLDQMVKQGSKLPDSFRVREDFKTLAAYFEYLINHVHDLYITLRTHPGLINVQDEKGKTLLFYAVRAANYLPKDRIQWIVHILLTTPNIEVNLTDIEGNTFLHEPTKHCVDTSKNKVGLKKSESIFFDHVLVPFADHAIKNNFNFQTLNKAGFAVVHLAAKIPSTQDAFTKNRSLVLDAPREFNAILALNPSNNLDLNQLSGENCTALYYAITCSHLAHIYAILHHSMFRNAAQRKVIPLLRTKIIQLCHELLTKLQERSSVALSRDISELTYHNKIINNLTLLTYILRVATGKSYDQYKREWPTKAFITKVFERFQGLNLTSLDSDENKEINTLITSFKLVARENSQAEFYDLCIWNFLNSQSTANPLSKIIIQTLQEEIEQIIFDVNKITEPFVEANSNPNTDYFKVRQTSKPDNPKETKKQEVALKGASELEEATKSP